MTWDHASTADGPALGATDGPDPGGTEQSLDTCGLVPSIARPQSASGAALLTQRDLIAARRHKALLAARCKEASICEAEARAIVHEVLRRGR